MKNEIIFETFLKEIEKTKVEISNLKKMNKEIEEELEILDGQIKEGKSTNISLNCKGIEKKTKINLLKKEMEVKKNYLNSILQVSRNIYEEAQLGKANRMEGLLDKINFIILKINSKEGDKLQSFNKEKVLSIFK